MAAVGLQLNRAALLLANCPADPMEWHGWGQSRIGSIHGRPESTPLNLLAVNGGLGFRMQATTTIIKAQLLRTLTKPKDSLLLQLCFQGLDLHHRWSTANNVWKDLMLGLSRGFTGCEPLVRNGGEDQMLCYGYWETAEKGTKPCKGPLCIKKKLEQAISMR